jgi:NAD(P)-dependent dehydrogenase (short-subunit alcohol dehydrogenase family)
MDLGINGLRVLITAGAGGIGLLTANAFLAEGARVHVCDIDQEALANLAINAPGATGSLCDVSDRDQVARLMDEAVATLGGLDCLVNNAGIAGPTGRVDEIDPEEWDRCLDITITGQFNCARLAIPHLKASKNASITNYSSSAGKFGFPLRSPYAAAKWGVIGFTKTLAMELGPNGIRCNAIQPGPVDGARIRAVIDAKARAANISFEEMQDRVLANQSIKQLIPPEQLANLTVYLASPRASLISGQELAVDGDMQCLA